MIKIELEFRTPADAAAALAGMAGVQWKVEATPVEPVAEPVTEPATETEAEEKPAPKKRTRKAKPKADEPVAELATEPAIEPAPEPAPEPEAPAASKADGPDYDTMSKDEVRDLARRSIAKYMQAHGQPAAIEMLHRFGAKQVSDLDKDGLIRAIAHCESALDG